MSPRVVAIVQARMGSTRLPGKVLADVEGKPLLVRLVERLSLAGTIDGVCIATTTSPADDALLALGVKLGIRVVRGSEQDVLDRYREAAKLMEAEVVVRITGDCPLIDPAVVDHVVRCFLSGGSDYVSNTLRPTYPDGLDTEVFSREALERAWREAALPSEREHVTPYIKNNPGLFRVRNIELGEDLSALRLTVDEPADLELVRRVFRSLGERCFGLDEIAAHVCGDSATRELNACIGRDEGYMKSLREDGVAARLELTDQGTGQTLYRKAKGLIPGGTQLLSKRPEMFLPELWPAYYDKARGAEVWDLDGNRYLDMAYSGVGSLILGACDPDVDAAVLSVVSKGTMSTLNCPEEVELAELLLELHPWAGMVRYARCGGEAMAVAVRIARAAAGRDKIALCGYHGWHDWYLSANLAHDKALDGHLLPGLDPAGVPRSLAGSILTFRYNDLEGFEQLLVAHGGELAAVVMEPIRGDEPAPGFLEAVRAGASRVGAALVFDEVSAGFRLAAGGAHLKYGVAPDVAVFAKAMSNGYPMAAIIGRREVMEAAQRTFISSTYWTERIGPAAALATIRKVVAKDVPAHLGEIGAGIKGVWRESAERHGLEVEIGGMDPLCHFSFQTPHERLAQTYFNQLMLERGILASKAFYATYAHTRQHVQTYAGAADAAFRAVAEAHAAGDIASRLQGPQAHGGFKRLNS